MPIMLKCGDCTVNIDAQESCVQAYRKAKDQFRDIIADRKYVLYFISKRRMNILPVVDEPISKQALRIRRAHDTVVHVLTDEVFEIDLPESSHQIEVEAVPKDQTEDWIDIIGSEQPTLQSFQVLEPACQPPFPEVQQLPRIDCPMDQISHLSAIGSFKRQPESIQQENEHHTANISPEYSPVPLIIKPLVQIPVKQPVNKETTSPASPASPALSKSAPKYDVEVVDGQNANLFLKSNEWQQWDITVFNAGDREWPEQRVGLYNCHTLRRLYSIPRLPIYEKYTLKVDCNTKQPLLLMEFQLGYELHGELVLFGPIMRCLLTLVSTPPNPE